MKPLTKIVQRFDTPEQKKAAAKGLHDTLSPIRKIIIADVEHNASRQPRETMDSNYVSELRADILEGQQIKPIVVFSESGKAPYFLADGWHRIEANSDFKEINAEVRLGGAREAFLFSLQANTTHGKRLTNADKRRKVALALGDEELSKLPDTKVAAICSVSHTMVAQMRVEFETVSNSGSKSAGNKPKSKGEGKPKGTPKPTGSGRKKKEAAPKSEPKTEEIFDCNGIRIPDSLLNSWRDEISTTLDLKMHLFVILDKWPKMYGPLSKEHKKTIRELLATQDIELCRSCKGEKCKECDRRGIVSRHPLV